VRCLAQLHQALDEASVILPVSLAAGHFVRRPLWRNRPPVGDQLRIHAPLLQVAWQSITNGLFQGQVSRFLALLVLGVPFVVVCAWAFYRVCEKPFVPKGGPLLRPVTSRTP
jgi:hypothetical protein